MRGIIVLFFIGLSTFCFGTEYNYTGQLTTASHQVLKFELHFDISAKNVIKGYSITAKGTKEETKSRIKGLHNLKNDSYFFYETVVLSSKAKFENLNFCLLTGTLYKSKAGGKINLTGNFLGFIRGTKKKCASGRISLFGKGVIVKKIAPKPVIKKMDTLYSNLSAKKVIDYKWPTLTAELKVWDDYNADGDVVSIYLNGKVILDNYTLKKRAKTLSLKLVPSRKNIIKIIANAEGKAPPNTARLAISDGKVQHDLITHIKKNQTVYIRLN